MEEQAEEVAQVNAQTEEKISAKSLFQEIAEVIKETFVAVYERSGKKLFIRALNGQEFCLTLREVKEKR